MLSSSRFKGLSETLAAYKKQFNIDAENYHVKVVNGTCEMVNREQKWFSNTK